MAKRAPKSYHHGNLEQALVEAALTVVERGGVEALSLREVARQACVSHAAPYHHFSSKAELLAGVAAAGFDQLIATIRKHIEAIGESADSFEKLRAMGRGYIEYATTHPSIFRLMFRPELTRPADYPVLREAEGRAFETLSEAIVALQKAGLIRGRDPRPPSAFAWSTVHGLAMLYIDQVFAETPVSEVEFTELAEQIHEVVLGGLKSGVWK